MGKERGEGRVERAPEGERGREEERAREREGNERLRGVDWRVTDEPWKATNGPMEIGSRVGTQEKSNNQRSLSDEYCDRTRERDVTRQKRVAKGGRHRENRPTLRQDAPASRYNARGQGGGMCQKL